MLLATLLFMASATSDQAAADAHALAEVGTLATLADIAAIKEPEEVLAAHPELTAEEQAAFRTIAKETAARLKARAVEAAAGAYLANLSPEQLAELAAQSRTPAAQAHRAAMLPIMLATVQSLSADGPVDFMGDTKKAFCTRTGKLCEDQ